MRRTCVFCLALCAITVPAALAAPPGVSPAPLPKVEAGPEPAPEPLGSKGLVKSGALLVLAEEPALLEQMKTLRASRRTAERESQQRRAAEQKIAANQKFIREGTDRWKAMEKRLPKIRDPQTHNRTVAQMNALAAKVKEAIEGQKDLEDAANKVSSAEKTRFVDELLAVAPKVDAVAANYKALAADASVKSALEKLNAGAGTKLALGPSPDFNKAIDEVATWKGQTESEAIPMREDHGVYTVEAIVNGEPLRMLVDTGASHVTLPFEVAGKLGLVPGEQDPTVKMKLANGAVIEGKMMTLKTVRVGRFTVPNVSCVVLQEGLSDPPTILGTSFLSHFVVKLSQRTGELHLTEVGDAK